MIQITERKASQLFEQGHSILVCSDIDYDGIHWDDRDANTLKDILNDWYDKDDGEITFWMDTQVCTMGKE